MSEFFIWILFMFRETSGNCICRFRKKRPDEDQRDWIKDISCMYHWMKSPYYKSKFTQKKAD